MPRAFKSESDPVSSHLSHPDVGQDGADEDVRDSDVVEEGEGGLSVETRRLLGVKVEVWNRVDVSTVLVDPVLLSLVAALVVVSDVGLGGTGDEVALDAEPASEEVSVTDTCPMLVPFVVGRLGSVADRNVVGRDTMFRLERLVAVTPAFDLEVAALVFFPLLVSRIQSP